jgi:hypothetical protein
VSRESVSNQQRRLRHLTSQAGRKVSPFACAQQDRYAIAGVPHRPIEDFPVITAAKDSRSVQVSDALSDVFQQERTALFRYPAQALAALDRKRTLVPVPRVGCTTPLAGAIAGYGVEPIGARGAKQVSTRLTAHNLPPAALTAVIR